MATKTWSYDTENGVAIIDSPTTQYLVDNSSTVTIPSHYVRGNTSYISGSRSRYYEIQYALYNGSDTNRWGDAVRVRTNTVANSSTNATVPASTISGINIWSLFNYDNPTTRTVPVSIRHEGGLIFTGGDQYLWDSSASSETGVIIGTINCTLNAPPTLTTGDLTFDTPYIYTGLTTASVRVSGLSAKYGGDVTEVKFTIGNQSVTRSGSSSATMSILLEAEGTFTPTVTVTDSRGQTTTKTLPAITVEGYTAPSAVLQAERTTATGVDDDEGEYAVLDTTFTFTDLVADLTAPTVTIDGTSATVTWYSSRATDGTLSGTVNWSSLTSPATVYGLIDVPDIQVAYSISLTPNDTNGSGTPITQTIASAFYTIDFLAGGHGIAFGQPASRNGFECNMPTIFHDSITMEDDVSVDGASVFNGGVSAKDANGTLRALFDFIHPVGSYYETSDTSFDPNTTWGGTWVSETILDDKIVSEGASGSWTYRKWSSGRVEAWYFGSFSVACTTASTAYGGYRSASIGITIPSGIFPSTPTYAVAIKNGANAHQLKNMSLTSATRLDCYFSNGASETSTVSVSIYAALKPTATPPTISRWHRTA